MSGLPKRRARRSLVNLAAFAVEHKKSNDALEEQIKKLDDLIEKLLIKPAEEK